jgi:coenzyme F420-reducing hydrogenase delta subunit
MSDSKENMGEKKKIVALCCENSSYKAAEAVNENSILDLVDIVRLPCSGKVEVGMVLKCLENDHPGVLILGCPVDNCKYINGNVRAQKRVEMVKKALQNAGINENRVHMDFISSVDSYKFITIVKEMNDRLSDTSPPAGDD